MDELYIEGNNNKLIVSFGGNLAFTGTLFKFEFQNFLEENFNDYDRLFYVDRHKRCYHGGIHNISNSIEETKQYLEDKIKNYEDVTFIGHSSGGYAAILFGSLLNVKRVIAFIPQTFLKSKKRNVDENYRDIKPYINNLTKYYLYSDSKEKVYLYHNIIQCLHIQEFDNVNITDIHNFSIREIRNSGVLLEIFSKNMNDILFFI